MKQEYNLEIINKQIKINHTIIIGRHSSELYDILVETEENSRLTPLRFEYKDLKEFLKNLSMLQ